MAKKMGVTMKIGNDGVVVITISNPPVNSLASPIISGLKEKFQDANHRSDVKAIVLTENGGRFSGGFNKDDAAALLVLTKTTQFFQSMLRSRPLPTVIDFNKLSAPSPRQNSTASCYPSPSKWNSTSLRSRGSNRMVEHGFRPDGVTYGTVLNRLCKYGETSMALDLLRKIKHQEAACCCS
ncbi:BnaA06g11400D [Brassica napus]|uniref:(rape) hypothetical protein n=1 Tax=Brassica napus TaxID=3708 RepID=A0A078H9L9_BRANA|nr:unnamed protein product [Brassica napus]CDY35130.1 BnaA06g11400D [Brassica napus]